MSGTSRSQELPPEPERTGRSPAAWRRRLSRLFSPALVFGLILVAVLALALHEGFYTSRGAFASSLFAFGVAVLLAVAVHEAGHWLMSRRFGFRTITVSIGPFRFRPTRAGWTWESTERLTLGGALVCLPGDDGAQLRQRWAAIVAAGPIASIVVGGAMLAAMHLSGYGFASPSMLHFGGTSALAAFVLAVLGTFAMLSVILGVVSLVPLRTGTLSSDGLQILRLARGGAAAERLCAQVMIVAEARGGVRPRDWPAERVDVLTSAPATSPEAHFGALVAAARHLDHGDVASATRWLDWLIASPKTAASTRALARVEAAWIAARIHGDVARAREHRRHTDHAAVPKYSRLKVKSAILLAEGDRDGARRAAAAALEALQRLEREQSVHFPAEAEYVRGVMAEAGSELDDPLLPRPSPRAE